MINTERLCPGCMNDNGGEKICPICGYDSASRNPDICLPVGFTLDNRYMVGQAKKRNIPIVRSQTGSMSALRSILDTHAGAQSRV